MSTRNISRYIYAYAYVRFLEWKLPIFYLIDCFYRIFKMISICPIVHLSKSVFVQSCFVQKCVCPIVRLSKSEQIKILYSASMYRNTVAKTGWAFDKRNFLLSLLLVLNVILKRFEKQILESTYRHEERTIGEYALQ